MNTFCRPVPGFDQTPEIGRVALARAAEVGCGQMARILPIKTQDCAGTRRTENSACSFGREGEVEVTKGEKSAATSGGPRRFIKLKQVFADILLLRRKSLRRAVRAQ